MDTILKDPDAHLDYGCDWSAGGWLAEGEQITTSEWIVPAGLTVESESNTPTVATVWLSGGEVYVTYKVTNRITTNQGRTDDRTLNIFVTQR